MITLPTTPVPPTAVNPQVLTIYGPPKCGKTTELSKLEDTLIIDIEDGTKYLKALKIKLDSIEAFIEALSLIRARQPRYRRIAIDTADKLEEWCEESATRVYKASTVGKNFTGRSVLELDGGGGYLWLRMEFKKYFTMVKQCADEVIFVCHLRDKLLSSDEKIRMPDGTFKTATQGMVSSKDLDLTGKCRAILCSQSDAIGQMFRDKEDKLWISFAGNEKVNCGGRCEHLKGKVMEFDWSKIYI